MTQLEQLKAICEKQKEIIEHYKCYYDSHQSPAVKIIFPQWGNYLQKLTSELSELEKIEIEEKKAFIDVAPPKDEKVCGNCKYFDLWGVVAGGCSHPELKGKSDRPAYDSCYRFEVK